MYQNRGKLAEDEQKEFLEHIIKNANQLSHYTQIALDIMFLEANTQNFQAEQVSLDSYVKGWLADARHRLPVSQLHYRNGAGNYPMASIAPPALHKILHILVEFALEESPASEPVSIWLDYDPVHAHIIIQHQAPGLKPEDAAVLFRLMHPRDLSESGRPYLHRMQLYVASLLAERQQGYLTLRGRDNAYFQIDLALPLASNPRS
jgi:K+-sensing histidine kinase KdpD